jgi:hypothetical protein
VEHMLRSKPRIEDDDEGDRLEPEYVMVVMTEIHRAVIRQAQGV